MLRTIAGVPVVGSPVRIDGERFDAELPPPSLGQHTPDILAGLRVDSEEIDRLRAAGIVG
jgi:crotonobetainyl-CoA:carnitine CoA-transferase CaiB-like acyl-CoA transferase